MRGCCELVLAGAGCVGSLVFVKGTAEAVPLTKRFELRSNAHLRRDKAVAKMGHPVYGGYVVVAARAKKQIPRLRSE
jgi:hypothetical protein